MKRSITTCIVLSALLMAAAAPVPARAAGSATFTAPYSGQYGSGACNDPDPSVLCAASGAGDRATGRERVSVELSSAVPMQTTWAEAWALVRQSVKVPRGTQKAQVSYELLVERAEAHASPDWPAGAIANIYFIAIASVDGCMCEARTSATLVESRATSGLPNVIENRVVGLTLTITNPSGGNLPNRWLTMSPWLNARTGKPTNAGEPWSGSSRASATAVVRAMQVSFT